MILTRIFIYFVRNLRNLTWTLWARQTEKKIIFRHLESGVPTVVLNGTNSEISMSTAIYI